jgi:hypothetical protein
MAKPKSNATSFKPRRRKTGGRKAGTRNKTTVAAMDAIAIVADRMGGVNGIFNWVKESPKNESLFYTKMYLRLLT